MPDHEHAEWERDEKIRKNAQRKNGNAKKPSPKLPDGGEDWKKRRCDTSDENNEAYPERYS